MFDKYFLTYLHLLDLDFFPSGISRGCLAQERGIVNILKNHNLSPKFTTIHFFNSKIKLSTEFDRLVKHYFCPE